MTRLLVLLAIVASVVQVGGASAASHASILLKVGDAVEVVGTRVACFAITASGKSGVACVLLRGSKAAVGTYGAGLSVDGTAIITRIRANGSGATVFKRRLQSARSVYKVQIGDRFGLQISSSVALGCTVINVTSRAVGSLYRGVKVSCWRATTTTPLGNTYGISISDKIAGWFRFDAKGRVTKQGTVWRQSG